MTKSIEKSVLGSLILSPELINKRSGVIVDLFPNCSSLATDILTQIETNGVCDISTLSMLHSGVSDLIASADPNNYISHLQILKKEFIRNKELEFTNEVFELLQDQDANPNDIIENINNKRNNILALIEHRESNKGAQLIEAMNFNNINTNFMSTGFSKLDQNLGGNYKGGVSVIGARPGTGKTTYAIQMLIQSGEKGNFISYEMNASSIWAHGAAMKAGLYKKEVVGLDEQSLKLQTFRSELEQFAESDLYITDGTEVSNDVSDCVRHIRYMNKNYGTTFFVIDYLQLMSDNSYRGGSRTEEIGHIVYKIKRVCEEIKGHVTFLSQMNRDIEKRTMKIPVMSDLRDSGAIEAVAVWIAFIIRDYLFDSSCDPLEMKLYVVKDRIIGDGIGMYEHRWTSKGYVEEIDYDELATPISYNHKIKKSGVPDDVEIEF